MPLTGAQGIPVKVGLGNMSGYLQKDSNLSDLPNKALSRTNLGAPAGVDKQMCTAWVAWQSGGGGSGAITIKGAYNVSSVAYLGVGNNRVNFTNPMTDTNYSVCYTGSVGDPTVSGGSVLGKSNNSVDTVSWSGSGIGQGVIFNRADHYDNNIQVFGGK